MKHLPPFVYATLLALQFVEGSAGAQTERSETTPSGVEISAQTRALFRKGLAAYNSGQVDSARQFFLQAWGLRPSADVAMQLAQTELDLGRYAEAAEHLEYALRNFTPSINEKMRNIARQAHSEARRHVARLNVEVDQHGAEVLVNGRLVGVSPLSVPLYAEPGNCIVQARLGHDVASQTLSTEPNGEFAVKLVLGAPTARATTASVPGVDALDPRPFSDESNARKSLLPVFVGGALATASIAAGIGLRLAANADENEANKLASSLGDQDCVGSSPEPAACPALRDSAHKSDRERNWSTACFVIGAAAVAGTAAYWFWPRKKPADPDAGVRVSGAAGPSSAGLLVSGAF